MPITYKKLFTDVTEEELMNMTRDEVTLNLNDRQRAFCEYYVKNYNIRIAAIKAGYKPKSAHMAGFKLRQLEDVNRYLAWLKLRVSNKCHVDALDVLDQYIKIAFADVTDFVKIEMGKLKLIDTDSIDGQLVKQIKQGKDGITVELADKMAALAKLERYFDVMPKDWKQKVEERKLELLEQKLELEKAKAGLGGDEDEDDGFIEALREIATEVWEDEEDEGKETTQN